MILAVVVALLMAFAVISVAQMLTAYVVAPPSAQVMGDPTAMRHYMMNVPPLGYIMVVIGWIVGAFAAGFIVTKMSRRESPGMTLPLIVGGVMTLGAIVNFVALPHPIWFVIVGLLVFIPFSLIGHKTAK
jgi:hypothetical protein